MKKTSLLIVSAMFISLVLSGQPQLSWRFANVDVINNGTQLQFDVEVKANTAGTFHRDLQVYFDYNTAGFGSDIVSSGSVSYTLLPLLANHYTVVNMVDNTSSKVAVITEALNEGPTGGQPGSSTYFNEITTAYQGLIQFTIDIQNNAALAGISFSEALMDGGQYHQSTVGTDPLKYADPSNYEASLAGFRLSSLHGQVTYANSLNTPLSNCTIELYDGAVLVDSRMTNALGEYSFPGIDDGTYALVATCSHPPVGFNIADAFVARQSLNPGGPSLTDLQELAADVNEDTFLNIADAFLLRLALTPAGQPPQWTAPDYVFLPLSADVINGIGNSNFQGLSSGDVNGSGIPPAD